MSHNPRPGEISTEWKRYVSHGLNAKLAHLVLEAGAENQAASAEFHRSSF